MIEGNHEVKMLKEVTGARETTTMNLVTDMRTGKSEIEIIKSFTGRFPTSDRKEIDNLFARITGGGGRKAYKIEDFSN